MKTEHQKHEKLATSLAEQRDRLVRELDASRKHAARLVVERDQSRGELKRLLEQNLAALSGKPPAATTSINDENEELLLIRVRLARAGVQELGDVPHRTLKQVENLIEERERDSRSLLTAIKFLKHLKPSVKEQMPSGLQLVVGLASGAVLARPLAARLAGGGVRKLRRR